MTGTTAIQLCQKGRQICMLQGQWSPQPLYKMTTWAANLHPASKILMETQGIWVQTRQFIISGTVLNIFFSADKNVNKMKSLIFAFVLKAKQEQVHFHLVCGQIRHIQWNAGCCVFGIWLLLPEASKDAVADNAEVYADGKEHWMLLLVLEQHITVYSLALLTDHWDKHKLQALSHVFCRGSLYCEASMMKVARLLLRWVCALQLELLDLHIALINQSWADLSYAPYKMHWLAPAYHSAMYFLILHIIIPPFSATPVVTRTLVPWVLHCPKNIHWEKSTAYLLQSAFSPNPK